MPSRLAADRPSAMLAPVFLSPFRAVSRRSSHFTKGLHMKSLAGAAMLLAFLVASDAVLRRARARARAQVRALNASAASARPERRACAYAAAGRAASPPARSSSAPRQARAASSTAPACAAAAGGKLPVARMSDATSGNQHSRTFPHLLPASAPLRRANAQARRRRRALMRAALPTHSDIPCATWAAAFRTRAKFSDLNRCISPDGRSRMELQSRSP